MAAVVHGDEGAKPLPMLAGALAPGAHVGQYEVIRRLGAGGMADVYLVRLRRTAGFEKQLVLKRLLPQLAIDAELVALFLDEARLTATLNHPNITTIYDVGQDGDTLFYIMEYVDGVTFNHVLKRFKSGPAPLGIALTVGQAVAAALAYAHDHRAQDGRPLGIVHRDVSPSNVLIDRHGAVKLSDFGIARSLWRTTKTRTGALRGKYPYMSPEQCRSGAVDGRSDIFSLGVMLYRATTGKLPFAGTSEYSVMRRIVGTDAPPPSSVTANYPPALEAVLLKAMAREPDERYQHPREMQQALAAIASSRPASQPSPGLADIVQDLVKNDSIATKPDVVVVAHAKTKLDHSSDPNARRTWRRAATIALVACAIGAVALWRASSPIVATEPPRPLAASLEEPSVEVAPLAYPDASRRAPPPVAIEAPAPAVTETAVSPVLRHSRTTKSSHTHVRPVKKKRASVRRGDEPATNLDGLLEP